jgi:hypothetical protein
MNSGMVIGPNFEQRVVPTLPPQRMKTYELRQPLATHFRVVSCKDFDCAAYLNGWVMGYDLTDPAKVEAANLIAKAGRKFTHEIVETKVIFTFPAGENCFVVHQVSVEREPIAIVRGGDWRGNPRGEGRKHVNVIDWRDDMGEHLEKIHDKIEEG